MVKFTSFDLKLFEFFQKIFWIFVLFIERETRLRSMPHPQPKLSIVPNAFTHGDNLTKDSNVGLLCRQPKLEENYVQRVGGTSFPTSLLVNPHRQDPPTPQQAPPLGHPPRMV